jgi:DNA-directed RNA polymerase sigma subunit (sigma70/sigma32)
MTRRQIEKQANRRRGEILKLRKQGLSMGVIGKLYGVTDERIRQILQANRVTARHI